MGRLVVVTVSRLVVVTATAATPEEAWQIALAQALQPFREVQWDTENEALRLLLFRLKEWLQGP